MQNEGHRARSRTSPRIIAAGLVVALASVALLIATLSREDGGVVEAGRASAPSSAGVLTTTTGLDPRTEIVDRLGEILGIRDKAFRERNAELLASIYTADCPCLEGDTNSIKELQANNLRLVGGGTSIRVQRVERVNARLWLIVADFRSAPLRIEAEGNRVIREEEAGSDLFQFALAKPTDSGEWLLGRATSYQGG
jgi:hypothetical protein